jgi:hypothetical protein
VQKEHKKIMQMNYKKKPEEEGNEAEGSQEMQGKHSPERRIQSN